MRVTFNHINAALASANLPFEAIRGNGYIYFAPVESAPDSVGEIPSVYTCQLTALTVAEWVDHVRENYAPTAPSLGLVATGRKFRVAGLDVQEVTPAAWQVAIVWGWGRETTKDVATYAEALDHVQNRVCIRPDLMARIELRNGDLIRKIWDSSYTDFQNSMILADAREAA